MTDRPATAASPEPEPTPEPPPEPTPDDETEVELRRRLDAIAATTTLTDDAWDTIQGRIDAGPARRHPRRILAVAAALAMVVAVAAVVVAFRGKDQGHVDTVDDVTTTTERDRPRATTTLPPTTTRPSDQPASVTPSDALDDLIDDLIDDTGGDPGDGGPSSGTDDPAGSSTGGGTPGTTAPLPVRLAPAAVAVTSDYTLELVFEPEDGVVVGRYGGIMVYLRRADGIGNTPDTPDRLGYVTGRGWRQGAPVDDLPCLGFERVMLEFDDAPSHWFVYGFAGPEVASAVVVLADGSRLPVPFGSGPGPDGIDMRGWVLERPNVAVDHVEALDTRGDVLGRAEIDEYGATTDVHC
jgi:hypothetical protein